MIRPYKSRGSTAGIAIVAVLISAVVFLGIIIAITGTLSLSSRQSTGDQRVTLEAQYASESGLSRVTAEANTGLLRTWSQLVFRMATPNSTSTTDIERLAKRFCNYADSDMTMPAPTAIKYCDANANANISNRYSVFSALIPFAAYADPTITPAPTALPTTPAQAEAFWQDAFSDGPSGFRYPGDLGNGVGYKATFGLEAQSVEIDGSSYVLVFGVRDSVSTGRYNVGAREVSNRRTTRSFPNSYRVRLSPPNFAYYLSITDKQIVSSSGGVNTKVYFNSSTLLDGPVFTNGAFYYAGNPWLSNTVKSAGCLNSYNATTKICTDSSGLPDTSATAFYNDGSSDQTLSVTAAGAQFSGYTTGAPSAATSPEFVNGNFNNSTRTTYTKGANPNPWTYSGEYAAKVVPFPTTADTQKAKAIAGGIYVPVPATTPAIGEYYGTPAPSVLLQATTTGRTTSTIFNTVSNNGTAATGQLIRFEAKEKISRCNAAPTGITINPLLQSINTFGSSPPFVATADGSTVATYEFAPVAQDFNWSVVSVPAGVTGTPAQSGTGNINLIYTSTAGATPTGQFVVLRATGPGGVSADAKLSIIGVAPSIGTVSTDSIIPYKQPNATANIIWPTATGTPVIAYELLTSANTTFSAPTSQAVSSSPTVVPINTSVNGAKTYYKVRATGPTAPAATTANYVMVTVEAQPPTVSRPDNFTSSNINYVAATRVMPYTGGLVNFDFAVDNATALVPNSGVGNGPFTYAVESRRNGGSWTAVLGANVSGNSVVNFSLRRNTSTGTERYEFRVKATATDTGLPGAFSPLNSPVVTVSSIVNPSTTLNTPSPSTPLDFGGGPVILSWMTPIGLNTPGPFDYQVQQSIGGGAWTNVGGVLNGVTATNVDPTLTTDYRVVTTDATIAAIPLSGRSTNSNAKTVTVKALDLPIIDSFTADTNPVAINASTPLRWNVRNAQTINVSRIAPVFTSLINNTGYTPNGSTVTGSTSSLAVPAPYADFQLTATNAVGTATRIIRVYAGVGGPGLPVPPTSVSLTAFPTTIYYPTSTSTLSWAATNATSSTITQSPTNTAIAGGPTTAGGDSRVVTLTNTTTYTLTASNAGGSVVRNAIVTVAPPANPLVSVTAVNPSPTSPLTSSRFAFPGGPANISWSVTNQPGSGSSSGSGTGPYDYVVYESVNSVENPTPIYTGTGTSTPRAQPANNGAADVVRSYRVVATNASTTLTGSAASSSLTVLQAQNPAVALAGNGPFNYPSGTASLTSSGVPSTGPGSTVVAGAGPYTYTLRTESVFNSGSFNTVLSTTSTPPNPFPQTLTNSGSTALVRRYQLTATNNVTSRSGQSAIVSVQVNPPSLPLITNPLATPALISTQAGGNSTISWTVDTSLSRPITSMKITGPNGYLANIPVVGGQANYSKVVPINIPGYGAKVYTITATGPLGDGAPANATVNFKPPEELTALNPNGSAISKLEEAGAITPGWSATPDFTTDHLGGTPTYTAADFNIKVGPVGGPFTASTFEAVSASISNTGVISLNIGTLPAARGADFNYEVRVSFTKNGITKGPVNFTVTVVKKAGSGTSLRPRARLTQTCTYGGPIEYSWPVFIEYYVEKNVDGTMTQYKRTYGSTAVGNWTAPATTVAPWSLGTPFNGVMFVDGGITVNGPPRTTATDPDSAAPAVANFAYMTMASDGILTVKTDLKYENPVCTTPPVRDGGTGIVTPATCNSSPTIANPWSRNVLGLYTSSAAGIKIKTTAPNTTIQAISMASTSKIEVDSVPQDPANPACPTALQTANNLGSINIQGGLIQKNYGQFGRLATTNAITCGYGRTMTYDIRMRNPSYQPPEFPAADNAEWSIEFYNGAIVPANKLNNTTDPTTVLPLTQGFSRIK